MAIRQELIDGLREQLKTAERGTEVVCAQQIQIEVGQKIAAEIGRTDLTFTLQRPRLRIDYERTPRTGHRAVQPRSCDAKRRGK